MTERSYFSVSELLDDNKFLVSASFSLVVLIGITYGVVQLLQAGRISADFISNVTLLSASDTSRIANAKPISELPSNPKAKAVYAAYVAKLIDLCAKGDLTAPKNSVILLQGTQTTSASAATLRPQYCAIAQRHSGNENVLVTSDIPFTNVPSEKIFIATQPISGSFLLWR